MRTMLTKAHLLLCLLTAVLSYGFLRQGAEQPSRDENGEEEEQEQNEGEVGLCSHATR